MSQPPKKHEPSAIDQDKKIQNLTLDTEIEVKDDGVGYQEAPPLEAIGYELGRVAEDGTSVAVLRQVVRARYPKTLEEGRLFLQKLKRMKDAAEIVLTIGQESQSGLENK